MDHAQRGDAQTRGLCVSLKDEGREGRRVSQTCCSSSRGGGYDMRSPDFGGSSKLGGFEGLGLGRWGSLGLAAVG